LFSINNNEGGGDDSECETLLELQTMLLKNKEPYK